MNTVMSLALGGVLIGLVFALMSLGLSLLWGVTNLINFAYAEYLMLAMYVTYALSTIGMDPLLSLPLVVIASVLANVVTYFLIMKRAMKGTVLTQVFVTFALFLLLRNGALFIFGPQAHVVGNSVISGTVHLFGYHLSKAQLVAALVAIIVAVALSLFLSRAPTGLALRATAEDPEAAGLVGINSNRMYLVTWTIAGICLGIAGDMAATFISVYPSVGDVYLLIVFAVVALGGMGSIVGTVIAGVAIGLIQSFAGFYLPLPALKYAVVFLIFGLVLVLRPEGLIGKAA